jgi:hypothetical protein
LFSAARSFSDAFFDSYKRGIDKQFIQKSKERNPELAKTLEKIAKDFDELERKFGNK